MRHLLLAGWLGIVAAVGWAAQPPADEPPRYDTRTVVELECTVVDAREMAPPNRLSGVFLRVKVEEGMLDVYLGPVGYVMEFEEIYRKGSRVYITGSRVRIGGSTLILARELRNGGATLYLRDRQGQPYWDAKGKRIS
jgi:hypothetical protein